MILFTCRDTTTQPTDRRTRTDSHSDRNVSFPKKRNVLGWKSRTTMVMLVKRGRIRDEDEYLTVMMKQTAQICVEMMTENHLLL